MNESNSRNITEIGTPVSFTCVACQQRSTSATYVKIDQGKYHAECVKCYMCQSSLPTGFVKVAGHPHCSPCADKIKNSRGTTGTHICIYYHNNDDNMIK
jgi:hypothetical protein